ncbi:MAG: lipoate--protein ligase family protein [Candidatus Omnitrophica bacterium]|nr:lipoate--protein ligase family protein [Candidatus Omnitrophota bacterium]
MILVSHIAKTPEENLALDEVMLLSADKGLIGPTLRFWESNDIFVVLGRACKHKDEVKLQSCSQDRIKVLRRISGGGTVLQGPGCLNYSLVLPYDKDPEYANINDSYHAVLGLISQGINVGAGYSDKVKKTNNVEIRGLSDISINGLKFSGNAQARKKMFFLQHGTILYDFDITKIPLYLKHPPKEPEYRQGRQHADFIKNADINIADFKKALSSIFNVKEQMSLDDDLTEKTRKLVEHKYLADTWNYSL